MMRDSSKRVQNVYWYRSHRKHNPSTNEGQDKQLFISGGPRRSPSRSERSWRVAMYPVRRVSCVCPMCFFCFFSRILVAKDRRKRKDGLLHEQISLFISNRRYFFLPIRSVVSVSTWYHRYIVPIVSDDVCFVGVAFLMSLWFKHIPGMTREGLRIPTLL